jgi:uncharacterized membrane protein
MGAPPDLLGQVLWNIGFSLCHQLPERSLSVAGYQLPMCARDTGTFVGFLVVTMVALASGRIRRSGLPDRTILVLSTVGFGVYLFDAFSSYLGVRGTTNEMRLFVGLAVGSGIALLLFTVLSRFVFRGVEERPLVTWRDIPAVYGPVALAGLFVYFAPPYLPFYYLVSLMVVGGYLSLVFMAIGALIVLIQDKHPSSRGRAVRLVVGAALIDVAFVTVLWLAHGLTSSILVS